MSAVNSWNCSSWILFLVLKIVLLNILIAAVIHGTNSALYLTVTLIPVVLQVKEMDLDHMSVTSNLEVMTRTSFMVIQVER